MGRRSNKSMFEEMLNQLWDLSACIWQVGGAIGVFFALLGIKSFLWVRGIEQNFTGKPIEAMFEQFSWLLYLIPIICLLFSFLFGKRAYASYREQSGI